MNIVRACKRNKYAVYLLTAFLTLAGAYSFFVLPSNIYPSLDFPRVMILVHSGDLSPRTMLLMVTRPIEVAVSTVQGVYRVRSNTIRGAAQIGVQFNPGMDMKYALQLVQTQVTTLTSSLPQGTEVDVEWESPTVYPVFGLILNGSVPDADLYDYAYYDLRPLITRVQGVGNVEVQTTDKREVSVIVDPQKLLAHRLSLNDVATALAETNQVTAVGRLPKDYLQYQILTNNQFHNFDDIRNAVVAIQDEVPVRVSDIADVKDGVEDPHLLVTGNGKPAATIEVTRQIGGDILRIVKQIRSLTQNLGTAIPKTLHISVDYDLAEFVSESIKSVRDAVLIGAALAILILFGFLRDTRTTLVAATSLPLSVIGTFFFLKLFHGSLNLMSLGGLAIAIGLIIDDAVVIIENIYRHIGLGEPVDDAADVAVRELLGAVVGSTATTLVVFLPLSLLQGVVGEFFKALCLTLGVSVLLSLIFALTIIPLFSLRFLTGRTHRASSSRIMTPVLTGYEKSVRWALRHRIIVAGVALGSVALAVFFYTQLDTGFLPQMDEGGFILDYVTPSGTSLEETNKILQRVEQRIEALPDVAAFSRRTGAENGLYVTPQNSGDFTVKLKPRSQRRPINVVINDLRDQINQNIPGVDVDFSQILQDMLNDLEGTRQPVEVKIFGDNLDELEKLVDEIGPKLQAIPGLVDYKTLQKGNPQLVFNIDPAIAGRLGMTPQDVSQQISAGLFGVTQTELRESDRTVPIRVRFPDSFRWNYNDVLQFPILTPTKQMVPLSSLAHAQEVQGESALERENQRLMVSMTGELKDPNQLGAVINDVKNVMSHIQLPVGYTYELGGQYESQQAAFHDLLFVLFLALGAIFIVLVVQFRSFAPALIILSAAPLSLVGVFGMLLATGTALNVSSFMGIILMVGLVVKNGIILFEYVHKLWEEEHMPLFEALVEAGKIRIRPILMTTLATLFGLLPLALGLGSGAELQKPLALAVIGGLTLSTFITLLLMPVLYSLLQKKSAA
ncbi:MAG TPA: efflux RND transporter permease subunit [Candidatus Acidoferrales bacterium]|nr:efflux RND transporter permease subunit [Candidatus Acidoferrales bacterium]